MPNAFAGFRASEISRSRGRGFGQAGAKPTTAPADESGIRRNSSPQISRFADRETAVAVSRGVTLADHRLYSQRLFSIHVIDSFNDKDRAAADNVGPAPSWPNRADIQRPL